MTPTEQDRQAADDIMGMLAFPSTTEQSPWGQSVSASIASSLATARAILDFVADADVTPAEARAELEADGVDVSAATKEALAYVAKARDLDKETSRPFESKPVIPGACGQAGTPTCWCDDPATHRDVSENDGRPGAPCCGSPECCDIDNGWMEAPLAMEIK